MVEVTDEEKDFSAKSGDKYERFLAWCRDEMKMIGVENLNYPVMWGEEGSKYPGIGANKDIKHHECFLAVPLTTLVSLATI